MADQPHPLRVLQLIGDTDPTEQHLGALTLHRQLADAGVEVRTLALAPGRRGGLDDAVPVMAPSRRSWTIGRVLDRESRWADVTLVHAPGALVRRTRRRAGRPPVVAVVAGAQLDGDPGAVPGDGVDRLVVITADQNTGPAPGAGAERVTHLVEPVDPATWRELLAGCAARTG